MPDSTERRRFERFEIQLVGQITQADGTRTACVARDCCRGGLLLQQVSQVPRTTIQRDEKISISVRPETSGGARPIILEAAVAWLRDDYLGVSFTPPLEESFELLKQHIQIDRQEEPHRPPVGSEARLLSKFRHLANGILPSLQDELLRDVEQALFGVLDRGVPDSERQRLYAEMSLIEQLRRDDGVMQAILQQTEGKKGIESAPRDGDGAADELSLVETDDFERWLEASRITNLLDGEFGERLNTLSSRVATLHRPELPSPPAVPFVPQHFAVALQEVAGELDLGETTRKILFDNAARLLSRELGGLYSSFDKVLDESGVPAAPSAPKPSVVRTGEARRLDAQRDAELVERELVAESGDSSGGGVSGTITIDKQLLARLLEREQAQRGALAQDLVAEVAELPSMTGSAAEWLALLEEPLTCEAKRDPGFFQNPDQPLRKIVDALGHLQMFRPGPDTASADDPLKQQVSDLLRPLASGAVDAGTLVAIANALDTLNGKQSRNYQRNVTRVAAAAEGRDRIRQARRAVLNDIKRRYAGRDVPVLLPELFDVGLRAVLELAALKGGEARDAYGELLRVIDDLVAALGGQAFEDRSDRLGGVQLYQRVERELATVAFDPFRRNKVEQRLRSDLTAPESETKPLMKMPALSDIRSKNGSSELPADMPAAAREALDARCAAIRVGDSLALLDNPDGPQALRVAWIRDDRSSFVTVDHRGLRARDISWADLMQGLYRRTIELTPEDGRAPSDRAVDALLGRMERELEHQTTHDSLTGLMNRQQFQAGLDQFVGLGERGTDKGALLCVDLDQFRLVNDIHGYDTGDRLLIAIARMLERESDTRLLSHLGGDRFGMLIHEGDPSKALQQAEAICEVFGRLEFDWPGQALTLSASGGLVPLVGTKDSAGGLLLAAENAIASAKDAGGNSVLIYREDDPDIAERRVSAQRVAQVEEALDHGRLRLRCQPIVPLRPGDGLQPHYEVLLDVGGDAGDTLPLNEFIAAAERYRRMRAIDRWVTQSVIEWVATQREQMPRLHGFAVNLSGQTVSDTEFVDFVRQLFSQHQIDPSWVSFEVTETSAVADLQLGAGIVRELKALGCRVALDDFGSGLASYSYLKELPVDWLKIDGVFVRKIAADRADLAVVKSINDIGHFLGKQTIAEYVADDQILRHVREIGVDYGQGYRISPPMLMDDLVLQQTA